MVGPTCCRATRDVMAGLGAIVVMLCIGLVAADPCLRTERLVDGRCEQCPTCAPGSGLNKDCGHGRGAGARCAPCGPGFYNPPPGAATCRHCTNCSVFHRQEAFRCRPVIDAECGDCLDGYYEDAAGPIFGGGFVAPCESCQHYPDHPQCRHSRPQVVAPVTIRLQAEVRAEPEASSDQPEGPTTTLMTVLLGGVSLLTLSVLVILLLRHRRSVLRRRRNADPERAVTSRWEDGRANRGYMSSQSVHGTEDNALLAVPAPHAHGPTCMVPARQAATWCPGLVLRPEVDARRKRGLESGPSSAEEGDDGSGESQTLLQEDLSHGRKRQRVTEVSNGKGTELNEKDPSLTLVLRPKPPGLECDLVNPVTSNNPHCSERFDAMEAGAGGQKHQEEGTETEGEDEDDGLPGDVHGDIAMDTEDNESGGATGTGIPGSGAHRGEETQEEGSGNDDDDDLQQYGACAMLRHYQPPPDESAWPYVDFHGFMNCSRKSKIPFAQDDLDLDLDLDLNDPNISPGSSGNISQASTVLIRGLSGSPPSSLLEDDSTLGPLDNGEGLSSTLPSSTEGPFHFLSSLANHSLLPDAHAANTEINLPIQSENQEPNNQAQMTSEVGDDVTDTLTPGHMTFSVPSPHDLPRRMASLTQTFTGSRGELADNAENETESIPRTVEILDEERYAQALRLAKDRLVAELDYDLTERMAAALHPRPLPGDHNARHLGAALGVPPEVLTGVHSFDEVLAHLRRRRVTIVVLLRAVRALGRMDVVYLLSQWVLENFSPPLSDGATFVSPTFPHLVVPETQGPLAEETNEEPTLSVQETGE